MKNYILIAIVALLASCGTPLNPSAPEGTSFVVLLNDNGNEISRHRFRPGSVGYDLTRHTLYFIDADTGKRVESRESWWLE
jgi:hypothetical protein